MLFLKNLMLLIASFSLSWAAFAGAWFKGDLHAHSRHSLDASASVSSILKRVESLGFDYFVLTEHDGSMKNGPKEQWEDPKYTSSKMALLYGAEWSTKKGHANIWNSSPYPYEGIWQARLNLDAQKSYDLANSYGAVFSVNHPYNPKYGWKYPLTPNSLDSMEVWNSMFRFYNHNEWAINKLWDGLLMQGKRVSAVGGSDAHHLRGLYSWFFSYGNPTTWVYADEKTPESILKGIRQGHAVISYGPFAPRINMKAGPQDDGNYNVIIGDNIKKFAGVLNLRISVEYANSKEAQSPDTLVSIDEVTQSEVRALESGKIPIKSFLKNLDKAIKRPIGVFKNGKLFKVWKVSGNVTHLDFQDQIASGEMVYYRVELLGWPSLSIIRKLLYGFVISMSNPIYVNYPE
ncbi:MAG: CehA/McbA family metallohydrolase [Pseudomonadota bacterium]